MKIMKNLIYNIAYQILVMIIPLITMPYIARIIGATGFGIYSYHYSIASYFGLFSLLGIYNYGVRSIATCFDNKEKRTDVFFNIYTIQLIASLLVILCYLGYVFLFVTKDQDIAYLQIIYLLSLVFDINWFYFGLELFSLTVLRNVVIKLLSTAAIFLFVKKASDVPAYTVIMLGGMLLSQLVLWISLPQHIRIGTPSFAKIKTHLIPIFILFLPAIASSVFRTMDKIMLGILSDKAQVGFYTQAEALEWTCLSVITALGTVMIPVASKLSSSGDRKKLSDYTQISFRCLTIFTIAIAAVLIGISPVFVPFFLGGEFVPTIYLTMLISPTMFFIAWENIIRTQYLIPNNLDKEFTISVFAGAIINFIANLFFIPHLKSYGAAVGTLLAEGTVFFIQAYMARHAIPLLSILKSCRYYFISGILSCLLMLFLGTLSIQTIPKLMLQCSAGGLLFLLLTIPYLICRDKELYGTLLQFITHKKKGKTNHL